MGIILALLKKLALNFVFELVWTELVAYLKKEAKKSETPIDDKIVSWFDSKQGEIQDSVKKAVK